MSRFAAPVHRGRSTIRVDQVRKADNTRYDKLIPVYRRDLVEHRTGHLVDHSGAARVLDDITEQQIRQLYQQAVARLHVSAAGMQILNALFSADQQAAFAALDWDGWSSTLASMKDRLAERAQAAAHAEVIAIAPGITAQFGGTMAKAAERAAAGVGEHIVGIDDRTRTAVRDIIGAGLRNGTAIPELTKQLADTVGLDPISAKALDRYEKGLITDGVEPARIRMLVVDRRDGYLRSRGQSIARTETMWASNQGRLDGFRYAAATGAVGTDAKKQWVTAGACCDLCADIDGEEVGLSEDFSTGDDAPPAHPNCRCTTVLSDFGTIPPEASTLVDDLLGSATSAEPAVTGDLTDLAASLGGDMAGLDFRIKSEDSLAGKIPEVAAEKGVSTDVAAGLIHDVLRYTAVFDPADYTASTTAMVNRLDDLGYQVARARNTWAQGNAYRGLNLLMDDPNGYRFELQFHTAASFALKQQSHTMYDAIAELAADDPARIAGQSWMARQSDDLSAPVGATAIDVGP